MKNSQETNREDDKQAPPAWIVSFTDMITLLLSFFIMLQALADMQDEQLLFAGRDSFRRAIAGLGVPDWLFGKFDRPRFEHHKRKHTTKESRYKIPKHRVLDSEDDKIRQAFKELREAMATRFEDTTARLLNKRLTPIRFAPSRADLNRSAKDYLKNLAIDLRQNLGFRAATVYVIGLAPDGESRKSQWLLSARRAKAVQLYLEKACADAGRGRQWDVLSWGAGQGGKWREEFGRIATPVPAHGGRPPPGDQSYIVIVVTGERRGFQTRLTALGTSD